MYKAKKNICLFKLPRPTLIFTPRPEKFLWYFGNAGGKCCVQVYLHTNLACFCTKRTVFNAQKHQFKTKKPFRPSITKKNIFKNKKIFRPTDPILFWHESLNRHIFFFGLNVLSLTCIVSNHSLQKVQITYIQQ